MTATAPARRRRPAPLRPHDPANIVEVDDLKVHFPIRAGIFQTTKGVGQGRRRRDLRRPPRRDARPGRRVGLRQEHDRPGDDPAARRDQRDGPVRRRRPRVAEDRRAAPDAPPDADHLPGPVRLARPADDGRRRSSPSRSRPTTWPRARPRTSGSPTCSGWSASTRSTSSATRTSSPAGSASASASPARSPSNPSSSSATSRSRRSTCRSRRRSSTC